MSFGLLAWFSILSLLHQNLLSFSRSIVPCQFALLDPIEFPLK
jgi:hypothetical protein